MNLKIRLRTVGYDNKILLSDGKFSLGKNDEVNALEAPVPKAALTSHQKQDITHKDLGQSTIPHEEKKAA